MSQTDSDTNSNQTQHTSASLATSATKHSSLAGRALSTSLNLRPGGFSGPALARIYFLLSDQSTGSGRIIPVPRAVPIIT